MCFFFFLKKKGAVRSAAGGVLFFFGLGFFLARNFAGRVCRLFFVVARTCCPPLSLLFFFVSYGGTREKGEKRQIYVFVAGAVGHRPLAKPKPRQKAGGKETKAKYDQYVKPPRCTLPPGCYFSFFPRWVSPPPCCKSQRGTFLSRRRAQTGPHINHTHTHRQGKKKKRNRAHVKDAIHRLRELNRIQKRNKREKIAQTLAWRQDSRETMASRPLPESLP